MKHVNDLSYCPRFILKTSEGLSFSTNNLKIFEFVKDVKSGKKVNHFKNGQEISIIFENESINKYVVTGIEIQQIKYNLDEPNYGINFNDSELIDDSKITTMEIYVFLEKIE